MLYFVEESVEDVSKTGGFVNDEAYVKRLHQASFHELKLILQEDLACPIDWSRESVSAAEQIFLEKWFYTVAGHLPNGELDAQVLRENTQYLAAPAEDSFEHLFMDEVEARSLAFNTCHFREAYRDDYKASCQKLVGLYAQPASERDKHYLVAAETVDEVRSHSQRNPNTGVLLPNFHPKAQLDFFWQSLSNAFEDIVASDGELEADQHASQLAERDEREVFEKAWDDVLAPDHFRLCVDTMTTIGFFNGKEARWLIYDISYHGKVVHCYPALAPNTTLRGTRLDNLQGLLEAFVDGRKDWP